jgi:hypothetical protein
MQTDCRPSADYPCLDCESAADAHEVHPFFDQPSWREGYGRGYEEGRLDGEHLAARALRTALVHHLQQVAGDVRFGLRHDLMTPLDVLQAVEWFITDGP